MNGSFALTQSEIDRFHAEGFVGPYRAVAEDEFDPIANAIDQLLQQEGPVPGKPRQSRHMDCSVVSELASRPEILDRMQSLYGPHLILWATYFFEKNNGDKAIPWHQDLNYWPLEPVINISAWIALDKVTIANSCVQLIPGSHKSVVPHIASTEDMEFDEMADPAFFDESKAVPMELEPGEFFLFNEKLLHYSAPHTSQQRRRGMTMRVTIPIVKITHDIAPLHPGHHAMLLRGEDYMGFNRLMEPVA